MTTTAGTGLAQDVTITAEQLRAQVDSGRPVVVLEVVRNSLADDGAFGGHIPGAQLVVLTDDLVGPVTAGSGNLPLPAEQQIQDAVTRWGINDGTLVAVYSREQVSLASRAWWTLRWAGVPDVRYLDGGLPAWIAAGGVVTDELAPPAVGNFEVVLGSLPVLDSDAAGTLARSGVLLDARNEESYVGDPEGGHIPGALNAPSSDNVDADGHLKSDDELRKIYEEAGLRDGVEFGAYCGAGTGATLDVLALTKIGVPAALYPGSFSAWSSDPDRPVTTGNKAG